MDTGHIAQSSIQWAHHCPDLCRQGRPNFLGQLSTCQLPTPFWDMMAGLAKAIAVSLAAPGHIRIPSQFPGPKEPPKGRGSDPPEGHSPRKKRGPSQGGGPSSSKQGSKPGGKNAPKPRLHGQFHPEADTVSPRGTMNPDFPSPMPPMAGDAEQLGKEGPRMPARFQGPTPH